MALYQFFKDSESKGRPLVLVTVFETAGSTYSKAGGQMIIDSAGNFCGMLSGGCLEGDLVERARDVIETGTAQTATYDLAADDELWGLGVGCDGTMRMLLQPLSPETNYQPFASIADVINGGEPAVIGTVISADSNAIAAGASVLLRGVNALGFGMGDAIAALIGAESGFDGNASIKVIDSPDGELHVLYSRITPAPALLVLGAGLDSEPVARFATELGWRCTIVDHRPTYIESRSYAATTAALCCDVSELSSNIDLSAFDMAVVMSHHLVSDRAYLQQLAESSIGYVGLLGPPGRRDRLLADLGDAGAALQHRLRGPAGIVLGGRGPGPIALEIVAEMQKYLADRG